MSQQGQLDYVPVSDIAHDLGNPSIRKALEMYGKDATPDQIHLAVHANDGNVGGGGDTCSKQREAILASRGAIQPVLINRTGGGDLVCIEGSVRVAFYQEFIRDGRPGNWGSIPALLHDRLDDEALDAARQKFHLIGSEPWGPYSRAKYYHHLRCIERIPLSTIVNFFGEKESDVNKWISAFSDMEKYYRSAIPASEKFDTKRFSGFVELQKPAIKQAIYSSGFDLKDFSIWIHQKKIFPLWTVRNLPKILENEEAKKIFIEDGALKSLQYIEMSSGNNILDGASLLQISRSFINRVNALSFLEVQRLKDDPSSELGQTLCEVRAAISDIADFIESS